MHHIIVTRVSLAFSVLIAGCILGFAVLVNGSAPSGAEGTPPSPAGASQAPPAPPGEALFESQCARCHGVDELAADLAGAPDLDARMAELAAFLESHGRANEEEDQAILQFLARQH